ncbi:MAG TPA: hypothetical protein VL728_19625 [Cyclobacteriaceae bacterium]|nr:hypothetical protein [Cyclobacteriaceae bacterium]
MPKKKQFNKTNAVLGYLLRYGSITRHAALTHFRVWNLPLEIMKLKKRGYNITSEGADDNLKYYLGNVASNSEWLSILITSC